MLKQYIREKHPHKSEADLQKIVDDITLDKHAIDTNVWVKIIEKMYLEADVQVLKPKIKEYCKKLM